MKVRWVLKEKWVTCAFPRQFAEFGIPEKAMNDEKWIVKLSEKFGIGVWQSFERFGRDDGYDTGAKWAGTRFLLAREVFMNYFL